MQRRSSSKKRMLEKKAARKILFPDLLSVPQPPPFAQSLILEKPLQSGNKAAAMFQCCLLCPSRFRFCRFRPEKEVFFFCHFPPLFGLVCTEYEKEGEAGNLQSIFARLSRSSLIFITFPMRTRRFLEHAPMGPSGFPDVRSRAPL